MGEVKGLTVNFDGVELGLFRPFNLANRDSPAPNLTAPEDPGFKWVSSEGQIVASSKYSIS